MAQARTSRKGSRVLTSISGALEGARKCSASNVGHSREGGLFQPARATPESQERSRGNSFFPDVGQSEMLVSLDLKFGSNLGCKLCTHELQ